jgi:hypothetical protein
VEVLLTVAKHLVDTLFADLRFDEQIMLKTVWKNRDTKEGAC